MSFGLPRAQPSLPGTVASKAQFDCRRHPAGKAPAIKTNLVKYRENLKTQGSGQLACRYSGTEVRRPLSAAFPRAGVMSQKEQCLPVSSVCGEEVEV